MSSAQTQVSKSDPYCVVAVPGHELKSYHVQRHVLHQFELALPSAFTVRVEHLCKITHSLVVFWPATSTIRLLNTSTPAVLYVMTCTMLSSLQSAADLHYLHQQACHLPLLQQ